MSFKETQFCLVCGFKENLLTEEWTICHCCGIEHGYEDIDEESILQTRIRWIKQKFHWKLGEKKVILDKHFSMWFDEDKRPKDWNPITQMTNINIDFRKPKTIEEYKKHIPNIEEIIKPYTLLSTTFINDTL